MRLSLLVLTFFLVFTSGQTGVVSPLIEPCKKALPSVVCINKYASVMPYHFFRPSSNKLTDYPFGSTSVSNDTSFAKINSSDFLVFDQKRGLELLGPAPTYDFVFTVTTAIHEAPVYVASQNKLYLSQLPPPTDFLPQLVIDLDRVPPTISEYLSNPPAYGVNGGTFHDGLIYWGVAGGIDNIGGTEQRSGLRTVDPITNKSTTILNNYYGSYFNTVDDLFVHPNGDVWFTDPDYGWFSHLTDTPPQLEAAVYRFRPSTGAVYLVEDTLTQPNGIALSPDHKTVYISDSGASNGDISPSSAHGIVFNATGKRTIYAYDISADATYIYNKRPVYIAQDWIPDGLKVAANGYIVTSAGKGVDILDNTGTLLVRVQTNYTVQNFVWTGTNLTTLWMMGIGGISKVEWNLQGQQLI